MYVSIGLCVLCNPRFFPNILRLVVVLSMAKNPEQTRKGIS
jgi:hypothetical protein